jgi:UDP-N-acetyl-D-mannosaminuronate dehydrogenase
MSRGTQTVAVVGLGKIGLPLAAQYAARGFRVIGCDINPRVVELTSRGESHVLEEAGLAERVREQVRAGRLSATTDVSAGVREADVVVCVVPG